MVYEINNDCSTSCCYRTKSNLSHGFFSIGVVQDMCHVQAIAYLSYVLRLLSDTYLPSGNHNHDWFLIYSHLRKSLKVPSSTSHPNFAHENTTREATKKTTNYKINPYQVEILFWTQASTNAHVSPPPAQKDFDKPLCLRPGWIRFLPGHISRNIT